MGVRVGVGAEVEVGVEGVGVRVGVGAEIGVGVEAGNGGRSRKWGKKQEQDSELE